MPRTLKLTAINPHVHLRDFGEAHKEDLDSGTRAAIAGGYTTVLDMPNNQPPVIDAAGLRAKLERAAGQVRCFYGAYVAGVAGNARQAAEAAPMAMGLKIYLDHTHGSLFVRRLDHLIEHFRTWPGDKPILVHAEDTSVPLAIGLAAVYGRRLHVCHISLASEIRYIRAAKEAGLPVTCEVTPHHLLLTEEDARALGPLGYMKPELKSAEDVAALWDSLDTIDCLADDHAPHTLDEKRSANPPPGVPGLETTLPLMLGAVREGRLTLERLIEMTATNPARIFNIPRQPETYAVFDLEASYTLDASQLQTKVKWSLFDGARMGAQVREVVVAGTVVYRDGELVGRNEGRLVYGVDHSPPPG